MIVHDVRTDDSTNMDACAKLEHENELIRGWVYAKVQKSYISKLNGTEYTPVVHLLSSI